MNKTAWGLFVIGLVVGVILLLIRPYTGYMDADYYYAGAKTLFEGRGWNDYALWNYLANPNAIPFPAFTYWMPMASIISALGMFLMGNSSLIAARIPFILLFAACAPLTYLLSYRLFKQHSRAVTSGVLVLASGYYLKFVTEPDSFAFLFLCGIALIYLVMDTQISQSLIKTLLLGCLCGAIHMARADGLIWLPLLMGWLIFRAIKLDHLPVASLVRMFLLLLAGYGLVTGVWYFRNLQVFGSPFPPGTSKSLWISTYDQLFTYPVERLSFKSWVDTGWKAILSIRWKALAINLAALMTVNGLIILVPGIVVGWRKQFDRYAGTFLLISLTVFFVIMTFIFPLAGMRGGLLHSLAIFQPFLWVLAPAGTAWLWENRPVNLAKYTVNSVMIQAGMVFIVIIISIFSLVSDHYATAFNQSNVWSQYRQLEEVVSKKSQNPMTPVIVNNPPAYYAATVRPALMIPYGDEASVLSLAHQFSAGFLLLDSNHTAGLNDIYSYPDVSRPGFDYLGSTQGIRVFQLSQGDKTP